MAVIKQPEGSTLRLMVQTGVDDRGEPVIRTRSYSRLKPLAADQDVYDVAQAMGGLQRHPLTAVARVDENSLISQ